MLTRRTALRFATASVVAVTTPAPGIIRRTYVDDLAGFVPRRTDLEAGAANRQAITDAFRRGVRTLHIRSGVRFAIDRALVLPSGAALVGEGTGEGRPTIVMPAAAFTNRGIGPETRYAANAVGIDASGGQSRGSATRDIRILNIDLQSEIRDGRALRGIVARNARNLEIANVTISGLPVGVGFCLASIGGASRISGCRARDCHSSQAWGAGAHPQITGLEIDNDRIADVATSGLIVEDFRAENLTVGPAFLAAHGFETDGVNICSPEAVRNRFRNVVVRNVGEGIDTFGCDSRFERVVAENCYNYGIKCVHGASRNVFDRPVIRNAGLAGITVSGSDERGDAVGNRFIAPRIEGIDPKGDWSRSESAAILITDNGGKMGLPRDTIVTDARIDLGPNGKRAWLDESRGNNNRAMRLRLAPLPDGRDPVRILHGAGSASVVGL